jgi:hypothetical protein
MVVKKESVLEKPRVPDIHSITAPPSRCCNRRAAVLVGQGSGDHVQVALPRNTPGTEKEMVTKLIIHTQNTL